MNTVKLKELYTRLNQKSPVIGGLIRGVVYRIRYRQPFNTIKKRIKGKGNVIKHKGAILSAVFFDIVGNGNRIEIRNGSFLKSVTFYIRGDHHSICIGEKCEFRRGGEIWFEDSNGSLTIGKKSSFENVHLAVTEPGSKMEIGQDCMFAYDIDVRTGDSHSILDAASNERVNFPQDVVIGNHVWVAAHCVLLKGVYISDESIVATGSIVIKKFLQKGVVIAGNPAKIVKEGVTWSRRRIFKTGSYLFPDLVGRPEISMQEDCRTESP